MGRHEPRLTALALRLLACGACGLLLAIGAGTADAQTATLGLGGWRVQSSALTAAAGAQISSPGFATDSWLAVTADDGGAVGTEIGALLQNGGCPQAFFSERIRTCFGYMSAIGPETIPRFLVPWWFRTDFSAIPPSGGRAELVLSGVVGAADVWVNGRQIATRATVQGAFTRLAFDITSALRTGTNTLALELQPNDPTRMLTLDNVDWSQIPPDNNTGVQFPIQLHSSAAFAIENSHVVQANAADLSRSALTLKADVTNTAASTQSATVTATVTQPGGGGEPIVVSRSISLAGRTTATVVFTPAQEPRLSIVYPQVWWPYQMGAQPLYGLSFSVAQAGAPADTQSESFGVRTIGSYLTGASPLARHGVRAYTINGRPFLFRAGGFAEDLFLRYSSAYTARQIALIKNLGLNGIRTEGKEMPEDFYVQMDRAGILIDAGFQCCDAWQPPRSGIGVSARDYRVMYLAALAIGKQLRDHPSVFTFSWSDNAPIPRQERVSLQAFAEADFSDPLVASAEYRGSPLLGPSGEKEGPYDWVPPDYWYDSSHFEERDPTRTNVGGAWGFDSEASAGDTVPTLDSIERFMSPSEQAALWQQPAYNQYHANYESEVPGPANGGYAFGTLYELDRAIAARYGSWSSLAQYVQEAQLQNYETQRAQFEAYVAHSTATPTPATGVVYWQLNKGLPTLLWDLYNQEFDQAGSYFGAKQANAPIHALYAYDENRVAIANLTGSTQSGLSVQAKVYDIHGALLDDHTAGVPALAPQGVVRGLIAPRMPAATVAPVPAQAYFVELLTRQNGEQIDRNVYWLSSQRDIVDWRRTIGNPHASMSQYADLASLRALGQATLAVRAQTRRQAGPAGSDTVTDVSITNTSTGPTVAFFLRADVRAGDAGGRPAAGDNQVLPTFWSANDITLWPGESQTLSASYTASALGGHAPVVSVIGWNVPSSDVHAALGPLRARAARGG